MWEGFCIAVKHCVHIFGNGCLLNILGGEVKAPSMSIFPPSKEEIDTGKATTVCALSDYTPRTADLEWIVDGTKWTNGVQTSVNSKQADNMYGGTSFLTMSQSEYNSCNNIACKVTHQGKEFIQTLKKSECL
ncbi:hypothetical protein GDO78_007352 [Eleutherodactylus coqui]|uniref:Ig-like domain-containing protein n=1 Tax=Eleutherodactylus coqui TaxID=57060 RepID=A0A8J6FI86_ELECQ|nr:hypothetical protein GDO78_007352 [Eleutherodactylus coqui]